MRCCADDDDWRRRRWWLLLQLQRRDDWRKCSSDQRRRHAIIARPDRGYDRTSPGWRLARWRVTNYCRTRHRSVVMMNGWRSVAAFRSAAIATPTSRTALRPPLARPTSSTVWWCCTRHCAVRKPAPCRRTGRSSRGPSARASSPDTEISQSLKRHW